jgi:hypothetical protein
MKNARLGWAVAGVAVLYACGGTLASVRLRPGDYATLHIGEISTVQVPTERHYTFGSSGSSLVLLRQKAQRGTTIYFYRATAIGNETLVVTPRDPGPGGCVSCVTEHYFIKVIQ